jgi:hypothetical protein
MAVEFQINGLYEMSFHNVHTGEEVDQETEKGILDNLQQGEYVISMNDKNVLDINDLQNPVYKFELDPTDSINHEFDEL